jgi:hypothetical protein
MPTHANREPLVIVWWTPKTDDTFAFARTGCGVFGLTSSQVARSSEGEAPPRNTGKVFSFWYASWCVTGFLVISGRAQGGLRGVLTYHSLGLPLFLFTDVGLGPEGGATAPCVHHSA